MRKSIFSRRRFIGKSVQIGVLSASGLAGCGQQAPQQAPNLNLNRKRVWRMATTWPPHFPILGEGCVMMAEWVRAMSQGALEIKVYGGGELVPPLEVFEAVSSGAIHMGHGAAYYWSGKVPAAHFFAAIPFGMNAQQIHTWIEAGGGQSLWEQLYEPFGLIPMAAGNTGVQMAGWFNRAINDISDFQGLKMRIPGLGARVLNKAGGAAVLISGNELYTSLERGVIDATEWIGPYHDYLMGFPEIARYYYYPGWHEPGAVLEQIIHKERFDELPSELRAILRSAAARLNSWILYSFEYQNSLFLQKIRQSTSTEVRALPRSVLRALSKLSREATEELASSFPSAAQCSASFFKFKKQISSWNQLGNALLDKHL